MMWIDDYEALNATEKTDFRRLVNLLLYRTYLLRNVYDDQKKMLDLNRDYRTAHRLFSILQGYFSLAGWDLYQDSSYGVIYLRNQFDSNHARFDAFTTKFLYVLRLIYEEQRGQVELYHDVRTDTNTVFQKMVAFGLVKSNQRVSSSILEAERVLSRYQVLAKLDGAWNSDGNELLIYPTILFFLPNSEIDSLSRRLQELTLKTGQTEEAEEGDEAP